MRATPHLVWHSLPWDWLPPGKREWCSFGHSWVTLFRGSASGLAPHSQPGWIPEPVSVEREDYILALSFSPHYPGYSTATKIHKCHHPLEITTWQEVENESTTQNHHHIMWRHQWCMKTLLGRVQHTLDLKPEESVLLPAFVPITSVEHFRLLICKMKIMTTASPATQGCLRTKGDIVCSFL